MTQNNCRVRDCLHQLQGVCQLSVVELDKVGTCKSFTHILHHERRAAP